MTTTSKPYSKASARDPSALQLIAITIAVVATVAAGFVFPLLPLIVGTAIGLAAYRHAPTKRNVFIGLGVAVTILSIAMAALMQAHTGPVVQYVETPVTVVHH